MAEQAKDGFKNWAILEIMGRQQLAGMVTEQTIAGTALLRVDVPEVTFTDGSCYMLGKFIEYKVTIPAFTTFVGGSSIYRLTPTTEAVARKAVEQLRERPVKCVDLSPSRALPAAEVHADPTERPYAQPDDDDDETPEDSGLAKCSKCGQQTDYVEAKAMFKCPSCGHEEMPF